MREWKQVFGNYLLADTVQSMKQMKTQIETFRSAIELVVTGLDRFTSIIEAIADVRKMASQAEVDYVTYQECFRTLRTYGIEFPLEDEAMARQLQYDWESLYLGSLYRSSTLESTFDRFSELTEDEIRNFLAEIDSFAEDFEAHGPGSIGTDLDLGLKKMKVREEDNTRFAQFFYKEFRRNSLFLIFLFSKCYLSYFLVARPNKADKNTTFTGIRQTDQHVRRETLEADEVGNSVQSGACGFFGLSEDQDGVREHGEVVRSLQAAEKSAGRLGEDSVDEFESSTAHRRYGAIYEGIQTIAQTHQDYERGPCVGRRYEKLQEFSATIRSTEARGYA